ncbi:DUF3052 domain-containing protein [Aeromicrobium sp. CF3.5]|uniref:DUF3052 domain-containing protein n=1 Tax=Aeromicrobium sp. CF3.5 TaxID=3373078 RepID=UPI003EE46B19
MDAAKLGFEPDTVIQELGWDEDADEQMRVGIEQTCGNVLVDGDYGEVVDGVVLWWRDGDGDLTDALVDTLRDVVEGGPVWLFTPKIGRDGYVEGADIAEAAPIAGLSTTTTTTASDAWASTKLSTHKR